MSAGSFDINKLDKKQSNIQVTREGSITWVTLHRTVVVTIDFNEVSLNTAGYRTPTTKVAINRALAQIPRAAGYKVVQVKKEWWISCPDNDLIPFVDGMSINF